MYVCSKLYVRLVCGYAQNLYKTRAESKDTNVSDLHCTECMEGTFLHLCKVHLCHASTSFMLWATPISACPLCFLDHLKTRCLSSGRHQLHQQQHLCRRAAHTPKLLV